MTSARDSSRTYPGRKPMISLKTVARVGGLAAALAAAVGAGLASAAPPSANVILRDTGCSVPAKVASHSVLFRVANAGRSAHTFTIGGRHVRVAPGRAASLRIVLPRDGRYPYTCTRRAELRPASGRLLVVTAPAATPTPDKPCGVAATAPTTYQHVVWIVFENKRYSQIIGSSDAPYINRIAGQCGSATSFYAEAHPSLPNYIAMTSGGTQGISDDSGPRSHPLAVDSIFSQLGTGWRALQESMPSNCSLSDTSLYAVRHNPAVYYTGLRSACATQDVPLTGAPDISARFTFVTPNTCHDMHSSSCAHDTSGEVQQGDTWLSTFLPALFATAEYRSGTTAVFVTWDEDDYSASNAQHIATLVIAPSVPTGATSSARFDHYSMLRTTEEMLGLKTFLGAAATAPSMRGSFHF